MKKVLYFLPILFLATSCDKDDDDDQTTGKTKTELITSASWKLETVGSDPDKDGDIDMDLTNNPLIQSCHKDNTFKLEASGTGVSDEGAAKCSSTAPQTTPFTWAFASNETEINISGNAVLGFGGRYKIITLNDTRLTLSKDTTLSGFGAATLVANFNH